MTANGPKPSSHAEPQEGQRARITGYYRGVILRLCVVVFALAVALIVPVEWHLKLIIYLAIMLVAVLAMIMFRAGKWAHRISN